MNLYSFKHQKLFFFGKYEIIQVYKGIYKIDPYFYERQSHIHLITLYFFATNLPWSTQA